MRILIISIESIRKYLDSIFQNFQNCYETIEKVVLKIIKLALIKCMLLKMLKLGLLAET